jgi:cytochrome bd-type quinol oxidase subunit 2
VNSPYREALMKIAAYILATINALIWGFLTWFGAYFLITSHQDNGYQPTFYDIAMMVAFPALVLVVPLCSVLLLRRSSGTFFATNCALAAVTLILGPIFIMQFGTGI